MKKLIFLVLPALAALAFLSPQKIGGMDSTSIMPHEELNAQFWCLRTSQKIEREEQEESSSWDPIREKAKQHFNALQNYNLTYGELLDILKDIKTFYTLEGQVGLMALGCPNIPMQGVQDALITDITPNFFGLNESVEQYRCIHEKIDVLIQSVEAEEPTAPRSSIQTFGIHKSYRYLSETIKKLINQS